MNFVDRILLHYPARMRSDRIGHILPKKGMTDGKRTKREEKNKQTPQTRQTLTIGYIIKSIRIWRILNVRLSIGYAKDAGYRCTLTHSTVLPRSSCILYLLPLHEGSCFASLPQHTTTGNEEIVLPPKSYQKKMVDRPKGNNVALHRLLVALLLGLLVGMELNCSLSFDESSTTSMKIGGDKLDLSLKSWQLQSSPNQYQLAYEQSLGYFFQSISNDEWKLRQQAARNATFHRYVGHPRRQWEKPNLWYYNNYDPLFSCPFAKRVRGIGDGPKWTCDPHQLKRLAYSRKKASQDPPCLFYSVGSNGNYQWEDGMYVETDGLCEIHVFDYSQNYTRKKNLERNIHFHRWGMYGSGQPARGPVWKTLPQIIQALGHEGRTIDIFKIDCEGCEWDSFQDWIGLDIRQILIETHSLPENKSMGLKFFDSFVQNNFVMFSKEVNPWGGGQYVEFSYIKLHPDFLGDTFQKEIIMEVL